MNVNTLKLTGEEYPSQLRHIDRPPDAIYWTGQDPQKWLDLPKVAIVGSRKMSAYGQSITYKLASKLAQAGE